MKERTLVRVPGSGCEWGLGLVRGMVWVGWYKSHEYAEGGYMVGVHAALAERSKWVGYAWLC